VAVLHADYHNLKVESPTKYVFHPPILCDIITLKVKYSLIVLLRKKEAYQVYFRQFLLGILEKLFGVA
jgi:hypothetical protein